MPRWHDVGAKVFEEMEGWGREHPHATFAEIEAAVEDRLNALRAELIEQELAMRARAEADVRSERILCEACGHPLQARGTRERHVTVRGNRPVRLWRRTLVCPACGAGHFPPG
ncbi:MAG: hypothetical protein ACRDJG_13240 [Actinomycetota bacterium]